MTRELTDLVEDGVDFFSIAIEQANDEVGIAVVGDFEHAQPRLEAELIGGLASFTGELDGLGLGLFGLPGSSLIGRLIGLLIRLLICLLIGGLVLVLLLESCSIGLLVAACRAGSGQQASEETTQGTGQSNPPQVISQRHTALPR